MVALILIHMISLGLTSTCLLDVSFTGAVIIVGYLLVYTLMYVYNVYTVVMIIILHDVDMLLVSSITILCNLNATLKFPLLISGAFEGAPQCRMSILRNANVVCHCRLFSPMPHVTVIFSSCRMSLSPM